MKLYSLSRGKLERLLSGYPETEIVAELGLSQSTC